jgi:hypothetical protein
VVAPTARAAARAWTEPGRHQTILEVHHARSRRDHQWNPQATTMPATIEVTLAPAWAPAPPGTVTRSLASSARQPAQPVASPAPNRRTTRDSTHRTSPTPRPACEMLALVRCPLDHSDVFLRKIHPPWSEGIDLNGAPKLVALTRCIQA